MNQRMKMTVNSIELVKNGCKNLAELLLIDLG